MPADGHEQPVFSPAHDPENWAANRTETAADLLEEYEGVSEPVESP
jgi:hypothetical protein